MNSGSGSFGLPGSRGGSAVKRFIPERKFIFYPKSKSNDRSLP
jgi:hypothetical protein